MEFQARKINLMGNVTYFSQISPVLSTLGRNKPTQREYLMVIFGRTAPAVHSASQPHDWCTKNNMPTNKRKIEKETWWPYFRLTNEELRTYLLFRKKTKLRVDGVFFGWLIDRTNFRNENDIVVGGAWLLWHERTRFLPHENKRAKMPYGNVVFDPQNGVAWR